MGNAKVIKLEDVVRNSVKKDREIRSNHSKAWTEAKGKGVPTYSSSDADTKKYIAGVVNSYRKSVGLNTFDENGAFGEIRLMSDRYGMPVEDLLNSVKTGDSRVLDGYMQQQMSSETQKADYNAFDSLVPGMAGHQKGLGAMTGYKEAAVYDPKWAFGKAKEIEMMKKAA